ncbi:uncharacterized protein LOC123895238 [Trifolium pratense]|uniref:Uncharacterized protein n=1 Tax=Trifolium pratense TaxID=57577 RepID=A0ACB0KRW0_TRIPR|nr:uncharacterized protein LOC123895238 [Trifolium pratense]CAJ2659925.1 unnamed protein product [Trifolium pratense]
MSAKMKMDNFSFDQLSANLLKDMNVRITLPMIMRVQLRVLDVLNWELPPVTAFCFLKHYYPYFKQSSGFKRRCINEIIVQAQGGHTFLQYKPYQIALSAFLAATKIAYPPKYYRIANPSNFHKIDDQEQLNECLNQMIDLCIRTNIQIEPAESGIKCSTCNSHSSTPRGNQ